MTASKSEAQLNLVEHIAGALLYFYTDDDTEEEQFDEISDNCGVIANLIVVSLNLDIYDVETENVFKTSMKLQDFKEFINSMETRTVIGD